MRLREKDDKLTINIKEPLASRIKDDPDLQKKMKGVKTSDEYPTPKAAKRAFVAGLIKAMAKKKKGGASESTASSMIDLVLEGYDPMDLVEKSPEELRKELINMKKDKEEE